MKSQRQTKRKNQSTAKVFGLILLGGGLILFALAAWLLLPRDAQSAGQESLFAPAQVNYPAPELSLNDLQGNPVSLVDYRDRVVLVNNWATWCPPCKAEMPILEAYYQAHSDQNFLLIGIEAGEPSEEVARFVEGYGLSFPIWLDPGGRATHAFQNDALPSSYVIDTNGAVRLVWNGPVSREMLDKYLTPFLEE